MTAGYGFRAWQLFLEQEKPITENWLGTMQNGSLSGLVTHSLLPFCKGFAVPTKTGSVIITLSSLLLVLVAAWVSRTTLKRARQSDKAAIDLPFALFAMLSVFLNPFLWEHYCVLSLQPMAVTLTMIWHTCRSVYRRWSFDECQTRTLVGVAAFALSAVPAYALVFRALGRDTWAVFRYIDAWKRTGLPLFHWQSHYWQALNFAPWIVGLFYAFVISAYRNRLRIFGTPPV